MLRMPHWYLPPLSSWTVSCLINKVTESEVSYRNGTMWDPQRPTPGTMWMPGSLHHRICRHYHQLRPHWWQPKVNSYKRAKGPFHRNTAGFSGLEGNLGDRMVISSVMPFLGDKSDPNQPSQSAHSAIRGTPSTHTIPQSTWIVLMDL